MAKKPLTYPELALNCLAIEDIVRANVVRGITDLNALILIVSQFYMPTNKMEMDMYSEAIISARLGVLN